MSVEDVELPPLTEVEFTNAPIDKDDDCIEEPTEEDLEDG